MTRVIAAIEAGNPAEAELAMRDHLSRSLASTDEMRARLPHYFRD